MDQIDAFLSQGIEGGAQAKPNSKQAFIDTYGPIAQRVGKELNVPAEGVLGQWGLETNWGKSVIPGTHNLGNIKDFSGKGVQATDSQTKSRDRYKQYESPEAFADDYIRLIKSNPRYAQALGTSTAGEFGAALQKGGYAEDPRYAQKLAQSAQGLPAAPADPLDAFLSAGISGKESAMPQAETQAQQKGIGRQMAESIPATGVLGAARKIFAPAAAAVTDIALQAPGAIAGGAAYASSRAAGRTPEQAEAFQKRIQEGISPRPQAIGEISGTTQEPGYKAVQDTAQFIGQNLDKGIDWIAQKLGMPKQDVANIAGTLSLAAPEVAGMAKAKAAPYVASAKQTMQAARQELGQPSSMVGVGAAETSAENLRRARAAELPVPMEEDLMKSQITRKPQDIQQAEMLAKDPRTSEMVQEKVATQNKKLIQNLEALAERTGAEQLGIEPTQLSQQLVDMVQKTRDAREASIRQAYDDARAAGEMTENIAVNPLVEFVKKNESASKNAPVISAIENEIKRLATGEQQTKSGAWTVTQKAEGPSIQLNDLEELRKMVSVLSQDSGPNSYYGNQALKLIDQISEGKGGKLYKEARKQFADYKKEFDNTPIMREITSLKPGTTERTVALENLIDKSLMTKSSAEVKKLFKSLQKMEGGSQMIAELKGALADKITKEVTKGSGTDMYGRPYVSPAAFKKTLDSLDKGGKLDFIFGKQQADQYRQLHKHAEDLITLPKGVVSSARTAETVLGVAQALGESAAYNALDVGFGGIPVGTIAKYGMKARADKKAMTRAQEFLNYGQRK